MQKLRKLEDTVLTTSQLCVLVGLEASYVGKLKAAGVIEQTARGLWPLLPTVPKIVEHRRNDRRRDDSARLRGCAPRRWNG